MRTCAACSEPLERREGEPSGNYRRRKYCDRTCMARGFSADPIGADTPEPAKHEKVPGSLRIDIRDKRFRKTKRRLHISASTTNPKLRDQREASMRKLLERGDMDVIDLVRTGKLHISEVDAAVRDGDYQRLKLLAAAPADTLGVAIRKTLRTVKATKEKGTLVQYTGLLRALEKKFGKGADLDSISSEQAEAFLHGPQAKGKPWAATVQKQASTLYRRVWKAGKARTQPWADVELPKNRLVRVAFLRPAEWQAIAVRHAGLPEMAMLALGCLAGLRISEMLNLRTDIDVDLEERVIYIQPRTGEHEWKPKTDNSVRTVPIGTELHAILTAHVRDGYAGERYFIRTSRADRPASKSWAAGVAKKAFERVGIRWGRSGDGLTYHSLRHTFASWLAQNDVQLLKIARLIGDNVETVAKYYAHLLPEDLTKAVAVIDDVARAA